MKLAELVRYCDDLLNCATIQDYAPNGLQVEGKSEVKRIVTGVTACQALLDQAVALQADLVLVHHGYFWKNEPAVITGMKQRRIKTLLQHDISLLAYHLPLDQHAVLGNNAQLAKLWDLSDITPLESSLVRLGQLAEPMRMADFIKLVGQSLGRKPLHLPGGPEQVMNVAWCSGGAQGYIQQALDWRADVYISGEVSEQTTHQALEGGIHYLAAGHYATERLGVKSLGEHLATTFQLEVIFVDIENPV